MKLLTITLIASTLLLSSNSIEVSGCQFYPPGEYLRFVRVPENLKVGREVLRIEVYPKKNLSLQPIDKEEDVHYFTYKDLNRTTVSLILARSLEDLVDTDNPRNVLKFRVMCDYNDGDDVISSSLSVTVYVEDLNDHSPIFEGAPYFVNVDELTPVGLTVYKNVKAFDRDKPNTPNSDVQYAITSGNERGKFALDSSHRPFLILNKPVDYDGGDREFKLTITASDRGLPPRSTNTTVTILIQDNDDLGPKFTKGVYRTKIKEFYPLTGERIHQMIKFEPPIYAFDQDLGLDSPIRYDILAGNDRHLFYLDHVNGSLFLEREIDLDSERSLPANTFVLQIQASQVDNPMKTGVARLEIEVIDLNDNLPEFEVDYYNISIVENLPNGFSVLQIIASDQDQGDNGEFTYQLQDQTGAFALDSRTGWLTVRDQNVLDREKRSTITMRVYAKEKTPSVITDIVGASSVGVEITLLDANDNNPTFIPNNVYDFHVFSDSDKGDSVGQVHAIDPDLGRNGFVVYSLQKTGNKTENKTIPFRIDYKTGHITISKTPIPTGRHLLFVEASDQPLNPSERRLSLAVVTVDVRKNISKDMPDFIGAPYEFWVGGNVGIGTSVGQLRVSDFPEKRTLIYDLLHGYPEGVPFAVEERSGTITVVDELANYDRYIYDFEGVASSNKDINLITNVTIHVVEFKDEAGILMRNNNSEPIEMYVKENQANVFVGQLISNNSIIEKAKYIKFFIANERDVEDHIKIYPNGTLYTQKPLDRESRSIYRLTIISEYSKGLTAKTGIFQITIHVIDENDNPPRFERDYYEGKIKENCVSGTEVDMNYPIFANDIDFGVNSQFTVTIFGDGSEKFRLDRNTGKVYFNSANTPLDREQKNVYNLRVVAKDKGGLYSEVKLKINIEDENDNAPNFVEMIIASDIGVEILRYDRNVSMPGVYSLITQSGKRVKNKISPEMSIPEDVEIGMKFVRLLAEDKDYGENAVIKYESFSETYIPNEKSQEPFHLTQYFAISSTTGDISVARNLPPESEFRLNVSATDIGGLKDYISVKIFVKDVNDHAPTFRKSWYSFDVSEESSFSKRFLGRIEASDADFGTNSNVTYKLKSVDGEELPFVISEFTGVLNVNGILDREVKDKYSFTVIASDNPKSGKTLSSTVNVDVNILDVNDNPPVFYGYDDVLHLPDVDTNLNIPIYYATIPENTPIGTPVSKVYANDSDYVGNGNGLLLFDMPYRKNKQTFFAVDSKEGIITTIAKLDYEKDKMHNVTIVASDLGSPSLSTTALLVVNVIDVPEDIKNVEHPVFAHRYYEVEVEENVPVPLKLLQLNVTEPYKNHKLRYSIVTNNKEPFVKDMFRIDSRNGTLFIVKSPDREFRALYELRIRLDQYKVGRDMTIMIYPVTNEKLGDLGLNEVKVIIRVIDVNDNVPKFTVTGRPFIAAIPTTANFGHHIIRLQARDPDLGLNGDVRYQILGRPDGESRRFAIDPITGQVRAIASFNTDAGKVYGFDVKATDRRGADDGKSSIANVFVYVLDEKKELVIVMGSKPTDVEKNMENITLALYNVTGLDVRIRKLQPHSNRNEIDSSATDIYLYAVDPILNVVVDMEFLQRSIETRQTDLENLLNGHRVLAIASGPIERIHTRNQKVLLSTLEIGVVVLGCAVFFGALITAVCVLCVRKNKRRLLQKTYSHNQPLSYTLASSVLTTKPPLFPSPFGDGLRYTESVDMEPGRYLHQHDVNCPKYPLRRFQTRERSRSNGGLETSITSLHSSGHDSGIVDGTIQCQCGQTTSQSSEDSSNSYEDSLKSLPNRKARSTTLRRDSMLSSRDRTNQRHNNFTEDLMIHRLPMHSHLSAGGSGFNHHNNYFGRSNERLVMTACPMNP